MGFDINKIQPGKERMFISTYQEIGYLKSDTLVVLMPNKIINSYKVDFKTFAAHKINNESYLINEAIAWYQTASYLYKNQKYKAVK